MSAGTESSPLLTSENTAAAYNTYNEDVEEAAAAAVTSRGHGWKVRRLFPAKEHMLKVFGIILVMCAGFSFTTSNVMQKFSVRELSFWQLLANRALVQLLGMATLCILGHLRHRSQSQQQGQQQRSWGFMLLGPRGVRARTISQGLLGGMLLACMFIAIKYVPLGNASAIMFCTPIFTFFMAPCMLGERFGLYRLLITVLMGLGVLCITRPSAIFGPPGHWTHHNSTHHHTHPHSINNYIMPDEAIPTTTTTHPPPTTNPHPPPQHSSRHLFTAQIPLLKDGSVDSDHHHVLTPTEELVGYATCFAVPFLSALISIITRQCNVAKVPVTILMFWFGVGATCVVLIASLSLGVTGTLFAINSREFLFLLSITGLGLFGNMCYTFAVKFVSPSLANVFRSFEVILNFVLQVELEKMAYHDINFAGIVLLLMAVIAMSFEARAHRKWGQAFRFL